MIQEKEQPDANQIDLTIKAEQVVEEMELCKKTLTDYKNNTISAFNIKIDETVIKAHAHALGAGNVTKEGLPAYIVRALARVTAGNFTISIPENSFKHITKEEYNSLCTEVLFSDPIDFCAIWEKKLRDKFSDYESDLVNKGVGTSIINKSPSTTLDVPPIKPVKSEWKIDMEGTLENSILILSVFVRNIDHMKNMIKVNKFDSFNIGQMKTYLCKHKTMLPNFAPVEIVFKRISK